MMGIFDLITNTIEGAAEVAVNTAKVVVGAAIIPLDEGKTANDAIDGIRGGAEKIGKSTPQEKPHD